MQSVLLLKCYAVILKYCVAVRELSAEVLQAPPRGGASVFGTCILQGRKAEGSQDDSFEGVWVIFQVIVFQTGFHEDV